MKSNLDAKRGHPTPYVIVETGWHVVDGDGWKKLNAKIDEIRAIIKSYPVARTNRELAAIVEQRRKKRDAEQPVEANE